MPLKVTAGRLEVVERRLRREPQFLQAARGVVDVHLLRRTPSGRLVARWMARAAPPEKPTLTIVLATVSHPLRRPPVFVVQIAEDGDRGDVSGDFLRSALRHSLRDALVRPRAVERHL